MIAASTDGILCHLTDIPDPGSRAFRAGTGHWPLRGFIVRRGEQVWAYLNRCPHAGHPLDWLPDRFLDAEESLIQCGSHGALFEIDSGYCLAGPCAGQSLVPIAVRVLEGNVLLVEEAEALAARLA
jgi:nitrite reductase/ring-hydroxylating ferredoxin subunit